MLKHSECAAEPLIVASAEGDQPHPSGQHGGVLLYRAGGNDVDEVDHP